MNNSTINTTENMNPHLVSSEPSPFVKVLNAVLPDIDLEKKPENDPLPKFPNTEDAGTPHETTDSTVPPAKTERKRIKLTQAQTFALAAAGASIPVGYTVGKYIYPIVVECIEHLIESTLGRK